MTESPPPGHRHHDRSLTLLLPAASVDRGRRVGSGAPPATAKNPARSLVLPLRPASRLFAPPSHLEAKNTRRSAGCVPSFLRPPTFKPPAGTLFSDRAFFPPLAFFAIARRDPSQSARRRLRQQVVIDFTATWCGPCQRIAPFFEELSTKYPSVTFVKVDVDEMDTISAKCGVRCMPTFMVYKDGSLSDQKLEGASPDALEALVKQFA